MNDKRVFPATRYMALSAAAIIFLVFGIVVGRKLNSRGRFQDIHPSGHETQKAAGQHDEHEGEGVHEDIVRLSPQEMKEFGIEVGTAGPGKLQIYTSLPGEIRVNKDKSAHIVPRVPGIVKEVKKKLGDSVSKGELLAIIESRDLADAKAAYLAGLERLVSAKAAFAREEKLWEKKISSEQEYISAKQAYAEAQIELRSAEQKLHAIGFTEEYLKKLPELPDDSFTQYKIVAPFDGTIIYKHITTGEVVGNESEIFIISDLSTVWVDLSVYQKDLPYIQKGQTAVISARHGVPEIKGEISYVGQIVGEDTRTALARIIIPNLQQQYRPGIFVTANVAVDEIDVPLLAPKSSLQIVEGKTCVFIKDEDGFEPRPVEVGRTNETHVEIVSGLAVGQRYVTKGAFTLKAQLSKSSFGEGHSH
ncbi:MAG: efflux RND transporter periplasmic adaptor subunit [Deltaproteobacteria bacterium]|nr:efflux RND transporter periplasmic adaptor subunit [Deltaproteobacteria bacterium]